MKTSILTTDFNFAKSINLSLIAAPDAYPSYPEACFGQAPKVNEFENLYTVTQ
jgi:hypothetical protein|nr:MAG TPA: hypothetical protein [Caudoviricetes sp.]